MNEAKQLLRKSGLDENEGTHDVGHLKIMSQHLIDYQIVVWHFDNHNQNIVVRDHFNQDGQGFVGLYFEREHYEPFEPHTGKDSLLTS